MSEKVSIKISKELYEAILRKIQNYVEFNSIDDFVEYVLWDFLINEEEAYDEPYDFDGSIDGLLEDNGKPIKGFSYL